MPWFVIATISALLSAAAAVGEKKTLHRIEALEYSFLLSIFVFLFSLWIPWRVDVASLNINALLIIFAKSIFAAFGFLFVMKALERGEISSTMPILALSPGVTALLALVTIHEGLRSIEWLGLGLMTLGTYVLEVRPKQSVLDPFKALLTAAGSKFLAGALLVYAVSGVADKFLISSMRVPPMTVVFFQHLFFCLLFGTTLLWKRRLSFTALISHSKNAWGLLLVVAFLTIGYRTAQLDALVYAPVGLVLAVKRTSVIYATLIGGRYFGEKRLFVKFLAACIIVAAGFIVLRNSG
jgi:drug/metabolite transporter (DMT)-like permease